MRSVEFFAGAGGLALGASRAGFRHDAIIEWDADACATIAENRRLGTEYVQDWPEVVPTDATLVDFRSLPGGVDLLSGGVPCQPWSQGGLHRGFDDERNLFPLMLKAIRAVKPKAVLIENVKGLRRRAFTNYFEYIKLQVQYPELAQRQDEPWTAHLKRLERHHTSGRTGGLTYQVVAQLLNAADFGVPQRRERVFIVAFRSDLGIHWSFPKPTHSLDSLLHQQYVTNEYWEARQIPKRSRPVAPSIFSGRIESLRTTLFAPPESAWCTVRDAISDLPDPERFPGRATQHPNHVHNPGARKYPGHTGSPWDMPSKTLKAGVHGVPGGENTLAGQGGAVRYFTVRESARLQTFPDDFVFHSSWTESMRQIGNAVPVRLAETIARHISRHLRKAAR